MKRNKIKFNQVEFPIYITGNGNGFFSQWCCGCGLRHIWHFKTYRQKKIEDDFIEINMMADDVGTKLRKKYENIYSKKN